MIDPRRRAGNPPGDRRHGPGVGGRGREPARTRPKQVRQSRRGDLVVVPFPYTDLSTTKQRPALVVSPEPYNREARDLVLADVTSVPQHDEWAVPVTTEDLASGDLPKPSWIRADKLFILSQEMPRGPVATVSEDVRGRVRARIRDLLVEPPAS